jgi:hypothetical protein
LPRNCRGSAGSTSRCGRARPVEDAPGKEIRAIGQEALGREERLVRVEALKVQEPAVVCGMLVQERDAGVEALGERESAARLDEVAVDVVGQLAVDVRGEVVLARIESLGESLLGRRDRRTPLVLLLPRMNSTSWL